MRINKNHIEYLINMVFLGFNTASDKLTANIRKAFVEIIREVAEYYSLPVLDLFATSGLQPEIKAIQENYIPDGLHPNDKGHELLAKQIVKYFQERK